MGVECAVCAKVSVAALNLDGCMLVGTKLMVSQSASGDKLDCPAPCLGRGAALQYSVK